VISFCFILEFIYDRRVKIIDCKHYGLDAMTKLESSFSIFYKNKFANTLTYFNYKACSIKTEFYADNKIPNIWLVDSNDILMLEIKHFNCFHTTISAQNLLRILNTVGLEYAKSYGFFIKLKMLIPFQRVLFEHGVNVKRKSSSNIDKIVRIYDINLSFSKEDGCYKTFNSSFLDANMSKPDCKKNRFVERYNNHGLVKSEDLSSFIFIANFVDDIGVVILESKNEILKLEREVDPCHAKFEDKVNYTPFRDKPVEKHLHKLFYDSKSHEANFRRVKELDESLNVMKKYINLNGEMDHSAKSIRDKNTKELNIKEISNSFKDNLKRLKKREGQKRKCILKNKELIFGNFSKNYTHPRNVKIRNEQYWLEKEKGDLNFRESLMNNSSSPENQESDDSITSFESPSHHFNEDEVEFTFDEINKINTIVLNHENNQVKAVAEPKNAESKEIINISPSSLESIINKEANYSCDLNESIYSVVGDKIDNLNRNEVFPIRESSPFE
jgi:hypothetical protein